MKTKLHGLVMAGGHSRRMGQDKALIVYHGIPQFLWVAEMLGGLGIPAHISCREDQEEIFGQERSSIGLEMIPDRFGDIGPMGGILSAMEAIPNIAFLVVACDLPLLDPPTLQFLINQRNPTANITCLKNPQNSFPEPLVAIWEPSSLPLLRTSVAQANYRIRSLLNQLTVKSLPIQDPIKLFNINHPEEAAVLKKRLTNNTGD